MKNRNNVNVFIDVLLFLVLAAVAGIGWLLKFKLLPGRERILKFGENRELLFLRWDRHQWGTVHLAAALAMLVLLVLHIVFHWKAIRCLLRNAVPSSPLRWTLTGIAVGLAAVFFLGAFVIEPTKGELDIGFHRNIGPNAGRPDYDRTLAAEPPSPAAKGNIEAASGEELGEKPAEDPLPAAADEKDHRPGSGNASLNGRMTLDEAAAACGISLQEARRRLGLPEDYPGSETLGRLRRAWGTTMIRIRKLLENPS